MTKFDKLYDKTINEMKMVSVQEPEGLDEKVPSKENMPEPKFKVGDKVTFTNDEGVEFKGKTIVSMEPINRKRTKDGWVWGYRYKPSDSPWFSVEENQLALES